MDCKGKADACYRAGEYKQAYDLYQQALGDGQSAAVYLNSALCLFHLNRWQDCVGQCELALKLEEGYVKARYRRALALEQLGQYTAAIQDFRLVQSAFPGAADGLRRCIHRNNDSARLTETYNRVQGRLLAGDLTSLPELTKALISLHGINTKQATNQVLETITVLDGTQSFNPTVEMLQALTSSGVEWSDAEDSLIHAFCAAARRSSQESVSIPFLCRVYSKENTEQVASVVSTLCFLLHSPSLQSIALQGLIMVTNRSHLPTQTIYQVLGIS